MGRDTSKASNYYKSYCCVPNCYSTRHKTPDKLFINVPRKFEVRKKWCERINIPVTQTSNLCVCEDHFNIEHDAENYMFYKMMGSALRMKKGVLPRIGKYDESDDMPTVSLEPLLTYGCLTQDEYLKSFPHKCGVCKIGFEDKFSYRKHYGSSAHKYRSRAAKKRKEKYLKKMEAESLMNFEMVVISKTEDSLFYSEVAPSTNLGENKTCESIVKSEPLDVEETSFCNPACNTNFEEENEVPLDDKNSIPKFLEETEPNFMLKVEPES